MALTHMTPAAAEDRPQPANDSAVEAKVESLLAQMTIEEKAAQVTTSFAPPDPRLMKLAEMRATTGGGSLLFVSDPAETNRLQRLAIDQSRLKIPLLFGFDVIHGLATIFPVPIANAASWDPGTVEKTAAAAAAESRAVGIHWTFAPMIDIARDGRWGRIVESAGEDPFLGSAMAAAQVRGFQGPALGTPGRIIAGPKHFVGYGAAAGGRDYDEVDMSDAQLHNVYLPPFKAAIDAGAANIMAAYMGFNGVPVTASKPMLTDLLRGELGFKGWIVGDNENVSSLKTHGVAATPEDAAALAINAGLDMEMNLIGPTFANLPAAIAAGKVDPARLDEAVRRVLSVKVRMGLFENPYVDEQAAAKRLRQPATLDLARVAAERSAVLLRNEAGLLPLDKSKLRSIAVIGTLADAPRDTLGPWIFNQNQPAMQSILEGIRNKVGLGVTVTYAPGVVIPARVNPSPFVNLDKTIIRAVPKDDDSGIAEAVAAAKAADVAVLVLGESQDMAGESSSRSTFELPGRQQELLDAVVATGKPTVVVLMNARPVDLKETKAGAILEMWYPGSRGGDATANLLLGDAVPGGKLPFTWPRNAGQSPLFYARLNSHDPKNADKRYGNESGAPAYPFGFGLSYSTFSYSDITVDRGTVGPHGSVTVSAVVTNTGKRSADEVVQLYIHQRVGSAARPVRELKGFERITLKPGERREVRFTLTDTELRYWSPPKKGWTVENSVFDVAVGGDSTAPFATTFETTGR
ncbi:glycoside hydrolase family 3 N-terminal domain-containing protein [Sphingomonas sp. 35-24ZXX]|uniref:glycoside hydrolase family 3 N-terminal domain-containing protein n=1 Tax=Sphingomonas sp. 35-24ZXX TaxID=1545915 RepID=UPI00053BFB60|nr:glycoside hydrolase family 3 N-terminal domain-containing protein [Sphingomonas sp. 35-24ZXX]